jgi:hypothetical protein
MKTIINTKTAGRITIESEYLGNKKWSASEKMSNWNNYKVTVRHNNKSFSFDFWASIMNPQLTSDEDNINAFYCALSDGICAMSDFDDFCSELGYDNDSRKAENIYKACLKTLKKLDRVFSCSLHTLINEIQETYNC